MSTLDTRDDLRELAEHYETVASLDLTPEPSGVRGVPGSRVPPGAQQILDADEVGRVLTAVDDWAEFCAHVLVDEQEVTAPHSTPARLREVGEHAAHFLDHEDQMLALAFGDDLHEHLKAMRRLSKRALRFVRTGMACQDPTCAGQYVSALPRAGQQADDAITCERCGHRVPHSVWSSWPRARVEWITAEHAGRILDVSVAAVWQRAKRERWRRQGSGREVRYHVQDVRGVGVSQVAV